MRPAGWRRCQTRSMKPFRCSERLFREAQHYIPGGVNSPVRAFKAVGGTPIFFKRGSGSRLFDADGNEFIDYVGSWGPLILGHSHPKVIKAVKEAVGHGSTFGAPTGLETTLAKTICEAVPSVELVRFVSSGTEAAMSAIRLARAFAGRDKIVKFAGCYHGHSDGLLAKGGSGLATFGIPSSPGVPASVTSNTLVEAYNDLEAAERLFDCRGKEIAAIIVEPAAGNMGLVLPAPGFLERLRSLTRGSGALLIFDEVITGFRVGYGGAQALYGVTPDLICLGKIIGGGLPVGAYGGRKDIMEMVAPLGPVYQAGTLSGSPLAMAAGIATLNLLRQPGIYDELERKSSVLRRGIVEAAAAAGVDIQVPGLGSMFTVFFCASPVTDYQTASRADATLYARFFHGMLCRGVYLPPSQFEVAFVSSAHTDEDIQATIEAAREAFAGL